MKIIEVILSSLAVATSVLAVETATVIGLEGPDYVVLLRGGATAVELWSVYALAFLVSGMAAWALGRLVFGRWRAYRAISILLLVSVFLLPVVNATLEPRPSLKRVLTDWRAVAAYGLLFVPATVWVVQALRQGRKRPAAVASLVLTAVMVGLSVANGFLTLRLTNQIASAGGMRDLILSIGAALVLVTPLLIALWRAHRGPDIKTLASALGVSVGVYAGLVVLTPERVPALPAVTREQGTRPSVLLIVIDTLRPDVLSRPGDETGLTPHIARLGDDSVWFQNAFSPSPWTAPAFGSILTSTYPSQHHAGERHPQYGFKYPLSSTIPTLAETLRAAGYWTAAVVTNPHLGNRLGIARGFEDYRTLMPARTYHPIYSGLVAKGFLRRRPAYIAADPETARIELTLDRARRSGRPFFVLGHYMDPHFPYNAPRIVASAPEDARNAFDRYRAETAYCDELVGRLLRGLAERGAYNDMLVIVTADHGEEFYEERLGATNGERVHDHGHTLFDELIHVPLIVKYPANAGGGTRRDGNVSLIDVAPTILDVCGVDAPESFAGMSLLDGDAPAPERIVFAEALLYGPEQKAIICGNDKMISRHPPTEIDAEFYNRAEDPGEKHARRLDPTNARHLTLYAALEAFAAKQALLPDSSAVEIEPHILKQLKSLGYIK